LYPLADASDLPHSETSVSYISENNFGPSNQIIAPTGYKLSNTIEYEQISRGMLINLHRRKKFQIKVICLIETYILLVQSPLETQWETSSLVIQSAY